MRERGRLVWVLTDPPIALRITADVRTIQTAGPQDAGSFEVTRWVPTRYVKIIDGEDAEVYARE